MLDDSCIENIRLILRESPLYEHFSAEEINTIIQAIGSITS